MKTIWSYKTMKCQTSPFAPALRSVPWSLFGTLTFGDPLPPEFRRVELFHSLLRDLCHRHPRSYFPKMEWILRQEQGSAFGRYHFHFLIAGLHRQKTTDKTCLYLANRWTKLVSWKPDWLCGSSRIEVYDPARGGLFYILKTDEETMSEGWESPKFGPKHCELMLSRRLKQKLGLS